MNYLKVMTLEAQTIARACGKNHLHNLEPEDLVALTMEAAAMAQVPSVLKLSAKQAQKLAEKILINGLLIISSQRINIQLIF